MILVFNFESPKKQTPSLSSPLSPPALSSLLASYFISSPHLFLIFCSQFPPLLLLLYLLSSPLHPFSSHPLHLSTYFLSPLIPSLFSICLSSTPPTSSPSSSSSCLCRIYTTLCSFHSMAPAGAANSWQMTKSPTNSLVKIQRTSRADRYLHCTAGRRKKKTGKTHWHTNRPCHAAALHPNHVSPGRFPARTRAYRQLGPTLNINKKISSNITKVSEFLRS